MNKNTIKAPCTILLAAVNVIVFLVLSFLGMTEDGEFMLKHGAMYVPYLIQRGEYYRLFSSMFLHFCMWQSVTEDGLETYPAEAWSL